VKKGSETMWRRALQNLFPKWPTALNKRGAKQSRGNEDIVIRLTIDSDSFLIADAAENKRTRKR